MEQTVVMPDLDRRLEYWPAANGGRNKSACRLRVWHERHVAMVTELDDNPGMSVTNAAEDVWTAVSRLLDCELLHPAWTMVEHYAATPRGWLPARFDVVLFEGRDGERRLSSPSWRPAARHGGLEWLTEEPERWS